jgi:hypothetical protein
VDLYCQSSTHLNENFLKYMDNFPPSHKTSIQMTAAKSPNFPHWQ